MTRGTTPLAVAADYADALMTARRAKNVLFLFLLLFILVQLAFFLLARFEIIRLLPSADPAVPDKGAYIGPIVEYAVPLINFAGVAFSVILAVVMLLLVTIMLVGRLIGVASVTSGFIWGVLLIILLIPWQTFLISDGNYTMEGGSASVGPQPAFKWPGSLYTYAELERDHKKLPGFDKDNMTGMVWLWGRYVGLPLLAMLVLFVVQIKSSRGLKFALGEADVHVEVTTSRQDLGPIG